MFSELFELPLSPLRLMSLDDSLVLLIGRCESVTGMLSNTPMCVVKEVLLLPMLLP